MSYSPSLSVTNSIIRPPYSSSIPTAEIFTSFLSSFFLSLLGSYTYGIPFFLGTILVVIVYFEKHSNHLWGPLPHLRHISAFFLPSRISEGIPFNSTLLSFLSVVISDLFLFFPHLSCRESWLFLCDLG